MGSCSPFVIEAAEVQRLCKEAGLSEIQYLATLVKPTQLLARAPISRFCVGAVGLGASGRIFKGVNLEFEGLPLNHSVHAEQFLVANAAQHGEVQLRFIAVSAAPCGHCRQFLQEVWGVPEINIMIADEHAETQSLLYFLPHRFGPDDLEESTALVFEPHFIGLTFWPMNSPELNPKLNLCNGDEGEKEDVLNLCIGDGHAKEDALNLCNGDADVKEDHLNFCNSDGNVKEENIDSFEGLYQLGVAALKAANSAHAPYSKCPSGIALMTTKGNICTGFYIESAAFNPSLSPLQAALVAFLCQDGGNYEDIIHAVLVEKKGAVVQQGDTIKLALQKISPKCSFHLLNCKIK